MIPFVYKSYAQVCSDAGFCTMTSMDNHFEKKQDNVSFQITESIGLGEQQVLIFTTQVDMNYKFKDNGLQLRVPYHMIYGRTSFTSTTGYAKTGEKKMKGSGKYAGEGRNSYIRG